ncbi:ATP-binding protein [Anaeromusa sp.]|uniref:sensor histidine kinase n=1 Tax=Anaeromusa sp. TaxID=1872520 RepID=UPI0026315C38|nr:ATP-binding protein [Anaeromusa sp.]MDD3158575.1 ATP-binding protein [Anaeromusa sp.]
MFRRLHAQFVFINLMVIACVFSVLALGSYWFLRTHFTEKAAFFSERMVEDAERGRLPPQMHGGEQPPPPPRPMEVYLGLVDAKGGLVGPPMDPWARAIPNVEEITTLAVAQKTGQGFVEWKGTEYFFFRKNLEDRSDYILMVQNFEHDNEILRNLMLALLGAGLACMALSLLGNIYWGRQAVEPVRQAWEQQRDFLADASHELRTPLTVILTNLSLLRDEPDSQRHGRQRWLENMEEEIHYMSDLVDGLLFLARSDAKQKVLNCRPFLLSETIAGLVAAFRPLARGKKVELRLCCKEDIWLDGDETRMRQVAENLLNNALRHTPEGGRIELAINRQDTKITLTVADTGEGISAENLPFVFHRFYQGDPSRSRGKGGLGLAIVKSIVENHSGQVSVSSRVGEGSEFLICLPALLKENVGE